MFGNRKYKRPFYFFKFCNSPKTKESTFIFATHLHELNNIIKDEATMYHLEVVFDEEQDTLVYNRKLKPGSGKAVYGLEVCKSMDMDKDFYRQSI